MTQTPEFESIITDFTSDHPNLFRRFRWTDRKNDQERVLGSFILDLAIAMDVNGISKDQAIKVFNYYALGEANITPIEIRTAQIYASEQLMNLVVEDPRSVNDNISYISDYLNYPAKYIEH